MSAPSVLRGKLYDYRIRGILSTGWNADNWWYWPSIWQAEVVPHDFRTKDVPKWALIKSAPYASEDAHTHLYREREVYGFPAVKHAACFRKMYDDIEPGILALEWSDTCLGRVRYASGLQSCRIIFGVLRAVLQSCVILNHEGLVNTGIHPDNMLLSNIHSKDVVAKVGNFTEVIAPHLTVRYLPLSLRAPEVWRHRTFMEASEIWAIAAMLLEWIEPNFLGHYDRKLSYVSPGGWCKLKLKSLFPEMHLPYEIPSETRFYRTLRSQAEDLYAHANELTGIRPFEEQIRCMDMCEEVRDVLRLMFVVDPFERPSACDVLGSDAYDALERLVELGGRGVV